MYQNNKIKYGNILCFSIRAMSARSSYSARYSVAAILGSKKQGSIDMKKGVLLCNLLLVGIVLNAQTNPVILKYSRNAIGTAGRRYVSAIQKGKVLSNDIRVFEVFKSASGTRKEFFERHYYLLF